MPERFFSSDESKPDPFLTYPGATALVETLTDIYINQDIPDDDLNAELQRDEVMKHPGALAATGALDTPGDQSDLVRTAHERAQIFAKAIQTIGDI